MPDAARNQALRLRPLAVWLQPSAPQRSKERLPPSKRRPWAQPQAHTPVSFSLLAVQCCTHRRACSPPSVALAHSETMCCACLLWPAQQACAGFPSPTAEAKLSRTSALPGAPTQQCAFLQACWLLLLSLWHWRPFQEDRQGQLSEFGYSVINAVVFLHHTCCTVRCSALHLPCMPCSAAQELP